MRDQLALNFVQSLARRRLRGLRAEKKSSQKKRVHAQSYKQTKISIHALSTLRDQLALNFAQSFPRHVLCGHAPAGFPEAYVIHQLAHMRLKALLALLRAPHLYAMFHKPFNDKWRFTLSALKSPSNFLRMRKLIMCAKP